MNVGSIIDLISRIPEGGIVTSENRMDRLFILSLLDAGRAAWLRDNYKRDKRIPAICYQKYYPEYSAYLQPSKGCFKKFTMPDVVSFDENSDGIRYAGSDDYDNNGTNNFDRVKSRAWLATYNSHPVMNTNNNRTYSFLYDASAGTLEFRGEKASFIRTPLVEAVFMHPLVIPTFNNDLDDYPLPMDGVYAVEKMIFANDTRIVEATTPKVAFQPSNTAPIKK